MCAFFVVVVVVVVVVAVFTAFIVTVRCVGVRLCALELYIPVFIPHLILCNSSRRPDIALRGRLGVIITSSI